MIEEWRDVVGWEGFYQVSNLGRVKSVDRICVDAVGIELAVSNGNTPTN